MELEYKICPSCGTQISAADLRCSECGYKFSSKPNLPAPRASFPGFPGDAQQGYLSGETIGFDSPVHESARSSEKMLHRLLLSSAAFFTLETGITLLALRRANDANRVLSSSGLASLYGSNRSRGLHNPMISKLTLQGSYLFMLLFLKFCDLHPEMFEK